MHLALEVHERLVSEGVRSRVVSMPCRAVFYAQDAAYRETVLPRRVVARLSVEAATTFGWGDVVGEHGASIGLDRFGASAPGELVFATSASRRQRLRTGACAGGRGRGALLPLTPSPQRGEGSNTPQI